MAASLVLRVFLSSPGDVAEERKLARETLHALEGSHLLKGRLRFEIVAWDDEHAAVPMDARETPQAPVNRYTGRPADCDLTLVILWSRIGTRLPPGMARPGGLAYESGTVWEYEDALAAGKPVFVYRHAKKPKIDLDDADFDKKRAQYAAVKAFIGRFENPDGSLRAGFTPYAALPDFGKLLRQHLEAVVNERMGAQAPAATAPIGPDDPQVSRILALVDEVARKNRQLDEKDAEIAALREANEALRRAAIARTLTAAAQPQASDEARAAGTALETGDTRPAEALLRDQEQTAAQSLGAAGTPQAGNQNHQAAELAREQGALAMGRDVRTALAAYLRAAEYEPGDIWTRVFIGDLYLQLGDSNAAIRSYRAGMLIAQKLAATDPSGSEWQTDVAVSAWKPAAHFQRRAARRSVMRGLPPISGISRRPPMKRPTSLAAALALAAAAFAAQAHGFRLGALAIGHPYARATAPGQPTGGGYLKLDNQGPAGDRLLGASAATVAERVELHTMAMDGDVMRMRSLGAIDLPAGRSVELKPGGTHLMLVGLKAPLKAGDKFPLKLRFEKAGQVEVVVSVEAAGTAAGRHGAGH